MPKNSNSSKSALTATQIITSLSKLNGWGLHGDGSTVSIEKTYSFQTFLQVISFVNAVAFVAEKMDHHPEMLVGYSKCSVRYRTHDVNGITPIDFDCAKQVDALVGTSDRDEELAV